MERTDSDGCPPLARKTLTIEQAAHVLGVSRSQGYMLARSGQLPTLKLGHRLVVPKARLDRMLNGE
jgi:excisionase family DNA binding protein